LTAFFHELFRTGLYKRTQGRIARQVTASVVAVIAGIGAWRLSDWLGGEYSTAARFGIPAAVFAFGAWFAYRMVNLPAFADFLISVEAEMNKVSWPGRSELFRASTVVIGVMFILAAALFLFDFFWKWLLSFLHVVS